MHLHSAATSSSNLTGNADDFPQLPVVQAPGSPGAVMRSARRLMAALHRGAYYWYLLTYLLLVRYLHPGVTAAEVREIFAQWGPLTYVRIECSTYADTPKEHKLGLEYNVATKGQRFLRIPRKKSERNGRNGNPRKCDSGNRKT